MAGVEVEEDVVRTAAGILGDAQAVQRADKAELLPYNYVVFGVSRCDP